jgi:hypothetical protein
MCDPTRAKAFTQSWSLFCSLVFDPDLILGQIISTEWNAEVVVQEIGKTCDSDLYPVSHIGSLPFSSFQ